MEDTQQKKFYVKCENVGCNEKAVLMCINHHDMACCDSCSLVLHSGCDTLVITDDKKLVKRIDILVKLVEQIQHHTKVFDISKLYSDYREELDLIYDKVTSLEEQATETIKSQTFKQYPYLMKNAKEIKNTIDTSLLYKNYCMYMQTRHFNDTVLSSHDQILEDKKNEAMIYFNDLHDRVHTDMMRLKDEEVKACRDEYIK